MVVHRGIPEDDCLRRQWNALERPEVFYTCEWAVAMHRANSATLVPLLVLAYEGQSLAGGVALATDINQEKTLFLAHATADYCDFVSHPERRPVFVDAVFAELKNLTLPDLTLANLPRDSATFDAVGVASRQRGYSTFSRPAYLCARIAMGSAEERKDLKQSLIKRKALRYALKGLAKQGPNAVDHLTSWEAITPLLPEFMQAHIGRFAAMGRVSNIAQPERQVFLTELARVLSESDWAVLTRLRAGSRAVAWNYGFRFQGSWFYYQPTFETSLQKHAPGVLLLAKMVEAACDDPDIVLIDLGLGAEGYKERFSTGVRQTMHVTNHVSAASVLRE